MPLTIRLLGSPEIAFDQQPLSFRTRKVLALFIYLVVEGQMHSREALMAQFWPESSAKDAAVTLRVTLSRLRQALQPAGEVLHTEGGKVGFDFRCAADLDLAWLSAAVLPEAPAEDLSAILDLDRGEFLAGFSLPDSPGFDDWVAIQRESCQRQVELVYDRLTQHLLANQEPVRAVETAARWVVRAPLSELAFRRLMAAQALAGDRPAALKTYANCEAMLQREFGMEPGRETRVLAEQIGRAQVPGGMVDRVKERSPARQDPPRPGPREARLPFTGRADEHSQLVAAFRLASQEGGRVVTVIGAAGVGKTRLVNAFLEWVAFDSPGVELWSGRAFEMGGRLPYQPVIEAMRERLEQENAPEDLLDDIWLAELSQLMPELRARYPDLPPPMSGDASFVRARLFAALAALGSALAARHPAVFILDDMQWADADTRDLVHYLARRWAESDAPVLLLLIVRQENFAGDSPLRDWLAQLGRDVPLAHLLLDPLSGADVKQLVTHLASPEADEKAAHAFSDWLWAETRGLPFFIEALLQMLAAQGTLEVTAVEGHPRYAFGAALNQVRSAGQVQVPEGVRQALLARIDRLSEGEAALLLAAAILGRECSFETLRQVADIPESGALAASEALLNGNLLTESSAARRPYTLAHDYIREVVYSACREARRRVFHRRALIVLEANRDPAAECAYHALASMLDEPAFRFSLIAGDEALKANAFLESMAHYDQARDAARRMSEQAVAIDDRSLRQLFQNRGRALELIEDYPAAQANYQEMVELAAARDDPGLELAALIAQCDVHARHTPLFNPPAARELGQAALELARSINDRAAEAAALGRLMFAALYGGEEARVTLGYGEASLSLARELGLKEQMGSVLIHLWMPYIAQKQLEAAFDSNREAEAIWRELENVPKLVETYDMQNYLYMLSNDHQALLASASESIRLGSSIGNKFYQANARMMIGDIYRQQGRLGEALREINAAIALGYENLNPAFKQGKDIFRMAFYLDAGALDQAEYYADLLYSLKDSMIPIFKSYFLNYIARVKIACGKFGEAQVILEQALELIAPDQSWSHYIVWIAITDAHLQLALGRPERAFGRFAETMHSYRQAGFCFSLVEELWLRGRVQMALGEVEAAQGILLDAKTIAEGQEERILLWQILATLSEIESRRGDEVEACRLRKQARDTIHFIADQAGEEEGLRASFLAQPEVVRVLAETQMRITDYPA